MTTFVLIPGAWLGGWVWNRINTRLEKEGGHTVYPITLTGMGDRVHLASEDMGIETAIQDVLNVVKFNDLEDFILVGHSFAGKVAASVADRVHDKVRKILYVDAFRPQKNLRTPQGAFSPDEFAPRRKGQWTIPLTEEIVDAIGKDVKGEDRRWLISKATPWPMKFATEPVMLSEKFDSVRNAFIFCTGGGDQVDEIVAGKWGKLDGPYKVIESGHWPMITKPDELAKDMLDLAG